jgi:hypothetical protein
VSSQTAAWPGPVERAGKWIGVARERLLALRPLYVLSGFVALQWAAVAALAVTVRHNGWIYYMGGDQLWHYTDAYILAHGHMAPTYVGIGWSTLLTPVAWLAGPDLVSGLPAIILFNTLVLLPLGVICMYGIGERIAGRIFGYWTALLWILLPFVGIRYALPGYHQKWTELTLPQLLGLGAMSDFPSMIALVVGAYLCLRALDDRRWFWPVGAGFAVGYALAIKPSNAVFLVAPALLFLVYRVRVVIPFAIGLVPCLAALGFWKIKGQGNLPWQTTEPARRVAIGPGGIVHRYLGVNNWTQLHNNLIQLREHLWSDRVLEFLAVAGIAALLVRSRRAAIFVGSWFAVFLLLKGTYLDARVEDASFWRLLMPAFPAFVVLVAAVPLLIPGLRARPAALAPRRTPTRLFAAVFAVLVAVLAIFPIALVAAAKPIRGSDPEAFDLHATLVAESSALHVRAQRQGDAVVLAWSPDRPSPGKVFYSIYRTAGSTDTLCGLVKNAPSFCVLREEAQAIGTTRTTRWIDRPSAGTWTYRVGIVANWLDSMQQGDVYVFSRSVTVRAP